MKFNLKKNFKIKPKNYFNFSFLDQNYKRIIQKTQKKFRSCVQGYSDKE